jgi:GNAT superfamily N-acetyltransferase
MADDVTVRPYLSGDLAACRALWIELTQAHRELYGDPSIGGQDPGRFFDRHLELVGPEHLWVAVDGEQVVGLVGLMMSGGSEGREAEVEPVVVAAAHRGHGVGQALLARVAAEARTLGVRYLSVKAVARNQAAICFYYHVGFCLLGEIEMFMDLQRSAAAPWQAGPELFGCQMYY